MTQMLRWLTFCCAVLALVVVNGEGIADIEITLKDGASFKLPVDGKDIKTITLDGEPIYSGTAAKTDGGAKTGAEAGTGSTAKPKAKQKVAMPALSPATPSKAGSGRTIKVGPGREFKTPRAAMKKVRDGDLVEIDAGEYPGDVAVWKANNVTLRGVGGFVRLDAQGRAAQGKAIWVIQGNNVTVENIEFSNATVKDRNGSGIRIEGSNLTVRNCLFLNNESGIMGGGKKNKNSSILVEHSVFANNGYGDGRSHGLYIGARIKRLTVRHSYIHHTNVGHQIKSRARENFILYNKLTDEEDGTSSYALDIVKSRLAVVIGNVLQQSSKAENNALVHFSAKQAYEDGGIFLINNTVVSDRHNGIFLRNRSPMTAVILNNVFVGDVQPLKEGKAEEEGNVWLGFDDFVDAAAYDFRLKPGVRAIDAAVDSDVVEAYAFEPLYEYIHPAGRGDRPAFGTLDAGAFEFAPQ